MIAADAHEAMGIIDSDALGIEAIENNTRPSGRVRVNGMCFGNRVRLLGGVRQILEVHLSGRTCSYDQAVMAFIEN
jgi:hypothetical protein